MTNEPITPAAGKPAANKQAAKKPAAARSAADSTTATRATVTRIQDRPTAQVLVIGGGINGIATFRDLALQGVDVVLVERGDYGSGASAASSHMIHGGVRYLENGEFRLVRESVQERNGLLRIAPHYVKPLQTTIPIFSTFSGILSAPLRFVTHKSGAPKERGALLIKIGLTAYDSFSRDGGSVPRHRFLGRKKSLAEMPDLDHNLKYTATYYDASVHEPERLALDVLKDGLAVGDNARAANYLEAAGFSAEGVVLRDKVTGKEFTLAADVVVNASGPWTDVTNEELGFDSAYMGGTKGSHIVLDNPQLLKALDGRELFFENSDGRIVLIYPLKGRILIGTTDLEADIREPAVCTEEEVDYFFDLISQVLPKIAVDRSQIVYRYSGIRPLPRHEDTQPGFVSRDYRIVDGTTGGKPLLSLVGGKWTTFRALSEHLTNEALAKLGIARKVSTVGLAIGGGKDFPQTPAARKSWIEAHTAGLDPAMVDRLLTRYGTRAAEVINTLADQASVPLSSDPEFTAAEISYFAEHEQAVHLIDVVLRRTNIAFIGSVTTELLAEMATLLGAKLGWSPSEREQEIADTLAVLHDAHGVTVSSKAPAAAASKKVAAGN